MNSRERIINNFEGLEIDRMAVSPFIHISFINEFYQSSYSIRDEIVDQKVHDIYKHFGFDSMVRTCTLDMVSPSIATSENWQVAKSEVRVDDINRIVVTTIKTPEREMTSKTQFCRVSPYSEVNAETEHFIKDEEDFRQFVKYQPPVPKFDCSRIARTRDLVGSEGVVAPWLPSIFNTLSRLRKLDDLLCDAISDPDFFNEMMTYYRDRTVEAANQLAKVTDIVTYEGNIANGSMVGPSYYEKYLLPFERAVIDKIRENNAYVLYHNCGDINNMYEVYNQLGLSALEPFTAPPYGDADIQKALAILNKNIVMLGNIDQITFLKNASVCEVEERVQSLISMCKNRGRFIIATSDYLEDGTPHENIFALANAVKKYGLY